MQMNAAPSVEAVDAQRSAGITGRLSWRPERALNPFNLHLPTVLFTQPDINKPVSFCATGLEPFFNFLSKSPLRRDDAREWRPAPGGAPHRCRSAIDFSRDWRTAPRRDLSQRRPPTPYFTTS